MARGGAREVALRVLRRVEEGAYVNLALDGESVRARLSPLDRRLLSALVYGVLKGRARLDYALAAHAPRGIAKLDETTLDVLRLGALQLLELRTPAHAAVDETVDALRRLRGPKLAGFANALLRKLASAGAPAAPSGPPARRLSVMTGAPEWVVEAAIARLGEAEAEALLFAEGKAAPLWLRINRKRIAPNRDVELGARLLAELARGSGTEATVTPSELVPGALALRSADGIFDTPSYVEGLVTAQDLGAQLVGALLDPQPGENVLDACAGLGGKSTHLAERMDDRGRVDAADSSARKLELGADHARRLGLGIIRSIEADLLDPNAPLLPHYDRVLLDAPCSGLGVARRHPEVRLRKGEKEIASLAALQAKLLDRVADRVRPGGVLVYAVCTYTDEEGPAQVNSFLARRREFTRDDEAPMPGPLRGRGAAGELRTWPHRDDADAFFAVRLRRA